MKDCHKVTLAFVLLLILIFLNINTGKFEGYTNHSMNSFSTYLRGQLEGKEKDEAENLTKFVDGTTVGGMTRGNSLKNKVIALNRATNPTTTQYTNIINDPSFKVIANARVPIFSRRYQPTTTEGPSSKKNNTNNANNTNNIGNIRYKILMTEITGPPTSPIKNYYYFTAYVYNKPPKLTRTAYETAGQYSDYMYLNFLNNITSFTENVNNVTISNTDRTYYLDVNGDTLYLNNVKTNNSSQLWNIKKVIAANGEHKYLIYNNNQRYLTSSTNGVALVIGDKTSYGENTYFTISL
jgi:hypothetical protein